MRRIVLLILALFLFALPCSAQTLQSYRQLALRVNLDDQVRVVDASGRAATGRLTAMTSEALVVLTPNGEQRFTTRAIRSIDVKGHAMRRGAAVGAAVFLGLNVIAASRNKSAGGVAGAVFAMSAGAGLGTGIGALIPQDIASYEVQTLDIAAPPVRSGASPFFDDIARRANLDDALTVDTHADGRITGRLIALTDDAVTLATDTGPQTIARDTITTIARINRPIRTSALIGAVAGAAVGLSAGCTGNDKSECFDGAVLLGGLSAGAGAIVGALIQQRSIVYTTPRAVAATFSPIWSRRGIGVHVHLRW